MKLLKIRVTLLVLFMSILVAPFVISQTLPKAIYNTNEGSEDLIDNALAGNAKKTDEAVKNLNDLRADYTKAVLSNNLSLQLLDFYNLYMEEINNAVKSKNYFQVAFAANQLTGIGEAFAQHFNNKISPYVSRLDYLGRDLLLFNKSNNQLAFKRRLSDIEYTWNLLKPTILSKNGKNKGDVFEKYFSEIKTAFSKSDKAGLNNYINKYLDQIDELEKLF